MDVEGSPRLTSLTRLSLANRMIVGLVTLGIIVFGVLATLNLKQELLPSIQVPTAIVTASYPGVSPQIVADDVSIPSGTRAHQRVRRYEGSVDLNKRDRHDHGRMGVRPRS